MEQRISMVTLGVADVDRSRTFYEALGWRGQTVQDTVFFQAGGLAVALWSRTSLAGDAGLPDGPSPSDVPGVSVALAHNVASREEVDAVVDAARSAGAEVTRPPSDTSYGGYAGYVRDPDGHVWEIAWNPGFALAEDGTITVPDFGAGA